MKKDLTMSSYSPRVSLNPAQSYNISPSSSQQFGEKVIDTECPMVAI